jgi:hypothetical protein
VGEKCLGRKALAVIRLHAVVEGQTEETFVNSILAPEFGTQGILIDAHRITTGRKRARVFRGGIPGYGQLKNDVMLWMKQDQNRDAWFTTMIDFYALPNDFPGYDDCVTRGDAMKKVECLEEQLNRDLSHPRFIPYIQLHAFGRCCFRNRGSSKSRFPKIPR